MTRQNIIYSLLLLLVCSSCKENFFDSIIEVKVPEHEPQLTVTAHLFNGNSLQRILINHSRGILDSAEIRPVTNAMVDLYKGDDLVANFPFLPYEDNGEIGRYISDSISFVSGVTYTLKVESTEYGNLESTQTVPTKVKINSATYVKDGIIDRYGERGDEISVQFDGPKGEKNYYKVSANAAYFFQGTDTSFLTPYWYIHRSPVDPIIEEAIGAGLLFSDASFDGKTYTLKFAGFLEDQQTINQRISNSLEKELKGELIGLTITLSSVSQDYYSFWKSMNDYENNKDNFFAEPTNVYENVEGGIGIFTINMQDEYVIEF